MKAKEYAQIFAAFKGVESDLIPLLIQIQEKEGYISPEAIRQVSRFLKISENQIYGVATFYPKFRFVEPGRKSIKVCMGTACHVRGGKFLADAVGWHFGISIGQKTPDNRLDFQRATCLGCCTLGPVVQIDEKIHPRMMVTQLMEILKEHE